MTARLCVAALGSALVFGAGCTPADGTSTAHGSIAAAAEETTTAVPRAAAAGARVDLTAAAPAEHWTGPGNQPFEVARRTTDRAAAHARRFGTITLETALRTRDASIGQYPCSSCHVGRRLVLAHDRVEDAHQDIPSTHPAQTHGLCATCHAADDVERLTLQSGDRASFDDAYRLCAQCHVQQVESWAGGAHGKRLDGWQGRRVLMGCADCHDPHQPALVPRIPFRAPRLERVRDGDR